MSMPPPPLSPQPVQPVDYAGYRRCPGCGGGPVTEPGFTWWGGVVGHKILGIARCESCKRWWVKKTGAPGTTRIIVYTLGGIVLGLLLVMAFALLRR